MTAPGEECCDPANNKGWRYLVFTLGAMTMVMFCCRFFLFHLFESPKFLLSRGRQAEAVATVHGIAYRNKTTTWLSEEILNEIGGVSEKPEDEKLTTGQIVGRTFGKFSTQRIAPLFAYRRLAIMTAVFLFLFTVRSDPDYQLAMDSLEAFFQNIMYGVLYA